MTAKAAQRAAVVKAVVEATAASEEATALRKLWQPRQLRKLQ